MVFIKNFQRRFITEFFKYIIDNSVIATKLNFTGFTGYEEITARLRKRMEEYREEWDEEQHLYGQQYWQQWRNYEAGEVRGVDKPKGVNMMNQVKDWGLEKR